MAKKKRQRAASKGRGGNAQEIVAGHMRKLGITPSPPTGVGQHGSHDAPHPTLAKSQLAARIAGRDGKLLRVGVIGLGYVGLPLAVALAKLPRTHVVGVDANPPLINELLNGCLHTEGPPINGVDRKTIATLNCSAVPALEFARADEPWQWVMPDVWIICVPTPLCHEPTPDADSITDGPVPDYSAVFSAAQFVADCSRGRYDPFLVVLESTVGPGATRHLVEPLIQRQTRAQVFCAFAPERINPGGDLGVHQVPRVVGGTTDHATDMALTLYTRLLSGSPFETPVVAAGSAEAAEMAKLLENTYRAVNIAVANEFADACARIGVSYPEVAELAATKPYGFEKFVAGAGPGGHCIPVDPFYLTDVMAKSLRLETNSAMPLVQRAAMQNLARPQMIAQRIAAYMGITPRRAVERDGLECIVPHIAIVGVGYKPGQRDVRESPGIKIAFALTELGADVHLYDPTVADEDVENLPAPNVNDAWGGWHVSSLLNEDVLATYDAVIAVHGSAGFAGLGGVHYNRARTVAKRFYDLSGGGIGIDTCRLQMFESYWQCELRGLTARYSKAIQPRKSPACDEDK